MKHVCITVRDIQTDEEQPLFCLDGIQSLEIIETEKVKSLVLGVDRTREKTSLGIHDGIRQIVLQQEEQDYSDN